MLFFMRLFFPLLSHLLLSILMDVLLFHNLFLILLILMGIHLSLLILLILILLLNPFFHIQVQSLLSKNLLNFVFHPDTYKINIVTLLLNLKFQLVLQDHFQVNNMISHLFLITTLFLIPINIFAYLFQLTLKLSFFTKL